MTKREQQPAMSPSGVAQLIVAAASRPMSSEDMCDIEDVIYRAFVAVECLDEAVALLREKLIEIGVYAADEWACRARTLLLSLEETS